MRILLGLVFVMIGCGQNLGKCPLTDASVPDLKSKPDLGVPDLAPPKDLLPPKDMSAPKDLSTPKDMCGPDLSPPKDLAPPKDMSPEETPDDEACECEKYKTHGVGRGHCDVHTPNWPNYNGHGNGHCRKDCF